MTHIANLRATALRHIELDIERATRFKRLLRSASFTKLVSSLLRLAPYPGNMSVHAVPAGSAIYVRISLSGLDSFKDPTLMALLTGMERLLSKCPPPEASTANPTTQDFGYGDPNREYRYRLGLAPGASGASGDSGEVTVYVTIDAYVRSDSPTCRIVKKEVPLDAPVTTRTETIIVCD